MMVSKIFTELELRAVTSVTVLLCLHSSMRNVNDFYTAGISCGLSYCVVLHALLDSVPIRYNHIFHILTFLHMFPAMSEHIMLYLKVVKHSVHSYFP